MNLFTNRRILLLIAALIWLGGSADGQASRCRAESVSFSGSCANIFVEFSGITTSGFEGKVDWPGQGRVLVEVFRLLLKGNHAVDAERAENRIAAFESDQNGKFCHPALP